MGSLALQPTMGSYEGEREGEGWEGWRGWFVGWLKRSPLSRHGCSFSSIMPGQEISRVEARQKLRPELYLEERGSDIPVIGVTGVRQFLQR